jgi:hypothetical protein
VHVDASNGSHTGEHPWLPLVSWPQTRLGPQSLSCVHWHSPVLQVPVAQVPQEPPQPSLPHARPVHEGVHVAEQVPSLVLHFSLLLQVPQEPPHPSPPHAFPLQVGLHAGGSGTCGSPGDPAPPGSAGNVGSTPASAEISCTVVVLHAASAMTATQHERRSARKGREGRATRMEIGLMRGQEPARSARSQQIVRAGDGDGRRRGWTGTEESEPPLASPAPAPARSRAHSASVAVLASPSPPLPRRVARSHQPALAASTNARACGISQHPHQLSPTRCRPPIASHHRSLRPRDRWWHRPSLPRLPLEHRPRPLREPCPPYRPRRPRARRAAPVV